MALGCLLATGTAAAMSANELFEDGNRLFRDDLYWAALLRYREAADAGMDTPLLHYNVGVAHYKAKQHDRAKESLQKAATYQPLAAISHYNLGLNAYAMGEYECRDCTDFHGDECASCADSKACTACQPSYFLYKGKCFTCSSIWPNCVDCVFDASTATLL